MDEAIQQRAAVVTEGGAPVAVDLKLVLCSGILQESKRGKFSPYTHDAFEQNPLKVSTFLSLCMKNEMGIKLNAIVF